MLKSHCENPQSARHGEGCRCRSGAIRNPQWVAAIACLGVCLAAGGCRGQYYLTVPDQVIPAGGQATAVVRLQRNEFAGARVPIKQATLGFQVDNNPVRGAVTDDKGYAAAAVPAGNVACKSYLRVFHTDKDGREVTAIAPAFVWHTSERLVAVDLDGLPTGGEVKQAAEAMQKLSTKAHVVYFTQEDLDEHDGLRRGLAALGYPDGPIFQWQREGWHIAGERLKLARVIVDTRMISSLQTLKNQFPNLKAGVCASSLAARAFADSGLKVIIVGDAKAEAATLTRVKQWGELKLED